MVVNQETTQHRSVPVLHRQLLSPNGGYHFYFTLPTLLYTIKLNAVGAK